MSHRVTHTVQYCCSGQLNQCKLPSTHSDTSPHTTNRQRCKDMNMSHCKTTCPRTTPPQCTNHRLVQHTRGMYIASQAYKPRSHGWMHTSDCRSGEEGPVGSAHRVKALTESTGTRTPAASSSIPTRFLSRNFSRAPRLRTYI